MENKKILLYVSSDPDDQFVKRLRLLLPGKQIVVELNDSNGIAALQSIEEVDCVLYDLDLNGEALATEFYTEAIKTFKGLFVFNSAYPSRDFLLFIKKYGLSILNKPCSDKAIQKMFP